MPEEEINEERLREDLEKDNKTLEDTNKELIEAKEKLAKDPTNETLQKQIKQLEGKRIEEQDKRNENISKNLGVDKEAFKSIIETGKIFGDGSNLTGKELEAHKNFKKFFVESEFGKKYDKTIKKNISKQFNVDPDKLTEEQKKRELTEEERNKLADDTASELPDEKTDDENKKRKTEERKKSLSDILKKLFAALKTLGAIALGIAAFFYLKDKVEELLCDLAKINSGCFKFNTKTGQRTKISCNDSNGGVCNGCSGDPINDAYTICDGCVGKSDTDITSQVVCQTKLDFVAGLVDIAINLVKNAASAISNLIEWIENNWKIIIIVLGSVLGLIILGYLMKIISSIKGSSGNINNQNIN